MAQSHFSLTWDTYQTSICSGFSSLQQNGEFVDMTLAADGHLVKVHQMLLALASPYFKELITSAPCPHPVIFLNGITHQTLCSILEYIYTGQVLVPADNLNAFVIAGKALHIKGLEDVASHVDEVATSLEGHIKTSEPSIIRRSGVQTVTLPSTMKSAAQLDLPAHARNIRLKRPAEDKTIQESMDSFDMDAGEQCQDVDDDDDDDNETLLKPKVRKVSTSTPITQSATTNKNDVELLYTMSNQGALQLILNRYLYRQRLPVTKTGVTRWRCIDYENTRCKACVRTARGVVQNREYIHNHTFHDKQIYKKMQNGLVYASKDEVLLLRKESNKNEENKSNTKEVQELPDL